MSGLIAILVLLVYVVLGLIWGKTHTTNMTAIIRKGVARWCRKCEFIDDYNFMAVCILDDRFDPYRGGCKNEINKDKDFVKKVEQGNPDKTIW